MQRMKPGFTGGIIWTMPRRARSFFALFAIAAFIFAQATTAAYACPGPVADPAAMAQMKAQMESDGGLCEKHCTTGTVSFEVAKPASFTMPAAVPVSIRIAAPDYISQETTFRGPAVSITAPAPPLIRFTVLRI